MKRYFVCDCEFLSDSDWNFVAQDKWRNMSVMANGWGSREKSRLAIKRTHSLPKQEDNSLAITSSLQSDEEMGDVKHFSTTGFSALQVATTPTARRPNVRSGISSVSVSFMKVYMLCCIPLDGISEVCKDHIYVIWVSVFTSFVIIV